MTAPWESVAELLGCPDGEPWSWAKADAAATESNKALAELGELFPLTDGWGLAEYLRNLTAEMARTLADYDALRATLQRVSNALESP